MTPSKLKALWDKAAVVAGAVITYVMAASVGLTAASAEIAELAPPGAETAVAWIIRAVAWLAAVVTVLRRVTTVPPTLRGLTAATDVSQAVWHTPDGGTFSYRALGNGTTTGSSGTTFTTSSG